MVAKPAPVSTFPTVSTVTGKAPTTPLKLETSLLAFEMKNLVPPGLRSIWKSAWAGNATAMLATTAPANTIPLE